MEEKWPTYLSVSQFAKYCGVNSKMVWRWIKNGEIKAVKSPGKKDYKIGVNNLSKIKIEKMDKICSHLEYQIRDQSKVLIVDDEPNVIESIASTFSDCGFKIVSTTNAYEAVLLLQTERPLFLTLDLKMIDHNGIEILKLINDLGLKQNMWVIIISAANESVLQSAVDLGADFYLQKPFSENDLNKIIKKLSLDLKKKAA